MNYWYAARPNEIFLDLDSDRALTRAMSVIRRILVDSPRSCDRRYRNELLIESVYHYATSKSHHHVIVVLKPTIRAGRMAVEYSADIDYDVRTEWALWMGADRIRAVYSLERGRRGLSVQDLLVSQEQYFRPFDAVCHCTKKHKAESVTSKCPALKHLLGEHASADYFPRNTDRKTRGLLHVPIGRVPLTSIRRWK